MNPVNTADEQAVAAGTRVSPLTPVGVSGLRQFSGYIREEFLINLTGLKGANTFLEMSLNDSTCAAILFAIKNMLLSMKWDVVPAGEEPKQQDSADILKGMLFDDMDVSWPQFLESVCSMFTYGYCVNEVVWKKRNGTNKREPWKSSLFDDGFWAPASLAIRAQRTIDHWIYDEEEHLLGFVQFPPNGNSVTVPMSRCLHFRTTAENTNPEGRSLLRTAYRSWYWLKRLQEIEGIGTERDLAGYPVLRVPGDMLSGAATPEMVTARQAYEDLLRKIRRDQNEGVLLPSDRDDNGNLHYEFELMSSGGTRQLKIDESITRYQKDIARSVLADFTFLGSHGGGSLALGEAKIGLFMDVLTAYANNIAAEINNTLVPMIWDMNGWPTETQPMVTPGEVGKPDLAVLGAFVKTLSDIGYDIAGDVALQEFLREQGGLPPPPEETDPMAATEDPVPAQDWTQEPPPDQPPPDQPPPPDTTGAPAVTVTVHKSEPLRAIIAGMEKVKSYYG